MGGSGRLAGSLGESGETACLDRTSRGWLIRPLASSVRLYALSARSSSSSLAPYALRAAPLGTLAAADDALEDKNADLPSDNARVSPPTLTHAALAGPSNEQRIAHRIPPVGHPLCARAYNRVDTSPDKANPKDSFLPYMYGTPRGCFSRPRATSTSCLDRRGCPTDFKPVHRLCTLG